MTSRLHRMVPDFDGAAFSAKVRHCAAAYWRSQCAAAKAAGVPLSTFQRIAAGSTPSIETYLRLHQWLGKTDEVQAR